MLLSQEIIINELEAISSNAIDFANKGLNDRAKRIESLLARLYEIDTESFSNIESLPLNNPDYDFCINTIFYQVTIRDSAKAKAKSFCDNIEKRADKYKIGAFKLIFFRYLSEKETKDVKSVIDSSSNKERITLITLQEIINYFVKKESLKLDKFYEEINKFYEQTIFLITKQKGPYFDRSNYISRNLKITYKLEKETNYLVTEKDFICNEDLNTIISGEPASGKSFLLKSLFYLYDEEMVPVYLYELKNYRGESFENLFGMFIKKRTSVLLVDASDEVKPEFFGAFCSELSKLSISFLGRILITTRTAYANQVKKCLSSSKYMFAEIQDLNAKDIDEYACKNIQKDKISKFNELKTAGHIANLLRNPFYLTNIIKVINNGDSITSSYDIISKLCEYDFYYEFDCINHKQITISRDYYFSRLSEISYFLVENGQNIYEAKDDYELQFLRRTKLCTQVSGNCVTFLHNLFKEYFASLYLSKFDFKKIIKTISIRVCNEFYTKPKYYNVTPFILAGEKNQQFNKFCYKNLPDCILSSPDVIADENNAISLLYRVIQSMNNNKCWEDRRLYSVQTLTKFLFTDKIRKSLIYWLNASNFRTSIIYAMHLLHESPPVDVEIANLIFLKIDKLVEDKDIVNDSYMIGEAIDLVGKLNIDIEKKKAFFNKFFSKKQSEIKHGLLSFILENNLSDQYASFITDCCIVHYDSRVIDGTLDWLSRKCVEQFENDDSFAIYFSKLAKQYCEEKSISVYSLDSVLDLLLKKETISKKLGDAVVEFTATNRGFREHKEKLSFLITKFNLSTLVFLNALLKDSNVLYEDNFISTLFNEDMEDLYIKCAKNNEYLKIHLKRLVFNLKEKRYVGLEHFIDKLEKESLDYKYNIIQNDPDVPQQIFDLMFEENGIEKIFYLFFAKINKDSITKEDIRNHRYDQVWCDFPNFVFASMRKFPNLMSKANISVCNVKFNLFVIMLEQIRNYEVSISEKHKNILENYIKKWIKRNSDKNFVEESENGSLYYTRDITEVLQLILKFELNLDEEIIEKLLMVPNFMVANSSQENLSNYIISKIGIECYLEKMLDMLYRNKLTTHKKEEFASYLSYIKYSDSKLISFVSEDIKKCLNNDNILKSYCEILYRNKSYLPIFSIINSLEDNKKSLVLNICKEKIVELAAEIKAKKISRKDDIISLYFYLIIGHKKRVFKQYLRVLSKEGYSEHERELDFSYYNKNDFRLLLKYLQIVLKIGQVEHHYSDEITPIVKYFKHESELDLKRLQMVCIRINKKLNKVKNGTYYHYIIVDLINNYFQKNNL